MDYTGLDDQVDHHQMLAVRAGREECIRVINGQVEVFLDVQSSDFPFLLLVHPDNPLGVPWVDVPKLTIKLRVMARRHIYLKAKSGIMLRSKYVKPVRFSSLPKKKAQGRCTVLDL